MHGFTQRIRSDRGYTLIELMFVVGITAVLCGMAVVQVANVRNATRGDAAMRVVRAEMSRAREMAITQRHYMRVVFTAATNEVHVVREDTTTTTTLLATTPLPGGARFSVFSGVPDTPDAFGITAPTTFTSTSGTFASTTGSTSVAKFAPDGTLVDWNGRTTNGSVYIAIPTVRESLRAVTVLGSTGRVRGFRWNGHVWSVV